MTKSKAWKRVAAGALALALVAGMMPTNAGGFLAKNTSIVASAQDEGINFTEATVKAVTTIYTGSALTPKITANGMELINNTDYTYTVTGLTNDVVINNVVNADTYCVKVKAVEGSGNTGETTVIWVVKKINPKADLFKFTAPENLYSNGTAKTATIVPATGVSGMGEITEVLYKKDGEGDSFITAPTDAGTYKAYVSTREGVNYTPGNNLTSDDWTFTIKESNILVTVPEGAVIEGREAADGSYTLECGKTYNIYSDETLNPSDADGLDISTANDKEYGGKTYNYKYTVAFADTIAGGTKIEFAHKHAAKAFSTDETHVDTDKVWAYCEGEPSADAASIAELKTDGTYYYGDAPTADDVNLSEYFGATTEVTEFFFTKKGDTTGSRVSEQNMVIGETYVVNATIAVKIDNRVSNFAITREIEFAARPLEKCDVYLVDGENETKLDIKDGTVTVPADTFTYTGEEQAPVIVIKNDILGTETVLTENNYTGNIEAQTDAGNYTAELTAVTGEGAKYTGSLTVNWSIQKATAEVTAVALDDIIYDGQKLDETDFTFTDEEGVLDSEGAQITIGISTLIHGSAEGVTLTSANDWGELDLTPGNVYNWNGGEVELIWSGTKQFYQGAADKIVVRATDGKTYLDAYYDNQYKMGMEIREGHRVILHCYSDQIDIFDVDYNEYLLSLERPINKEDDLTSAGNHNVKITITSKNYEDIELNVPATIAKRSVTLTPDADQKTTFGDKTAPTITYTVEEQNDAAKSGFIASDLAEDQTAVDFFGAAVKVGTEINTTNILHPAADDAFIYGAATNDAGTYSYKVADVETPFEVESQSEYVPFDGFYWNGWSAQIYTADELGDVTDINSLAYYATSLNNKAHTFDIYLLNTDKTALTRDDVDAINLTEMEHVISISGYTFAEEWNEFELPETFTREADDNLLVVVVNNTLGYGYGLTFATYAADQNSVWYDCLDGMYLTPGSNNPRSLACKNVLGINGPIQDTEGTDPNALKNYELTIADGSVFTVAQKDIADAAVTLQGTSDDFTIENEKPTVIYDGTTKKVSVESVTDGETLLTNNADYTIGGTLQKVYPGEFNVQISGQGNYTGIAYASWTVKGMDGAASIITTDNGVKTYDGEDVSELFTVDFGEIPESKATVTTEYYEGETKLDAAPVNAGTYTVKVKITAKGYTTQNLEADLTIEKADVTVTGTLDKAAIVYSDTAPQVTDTAFDGVLDAEMADFEENTTVDWTLDEETNQYNGVVNTTDEYNNNYRFTVEPVGYAVAPKDIESTDIRVTYTSKTKLNESDWTICDDIVVIDTKTGKILAEGTDYTVNGITSKEIGTFTIEIIGIGDYTGIKELPWEVVETEEEAAIARIAAYQTYDDEGRINFTVTNTYNGDKDVTYGYLLYRGSITDMTIEDAAANADIINATYDFQTAAFRAKDRGSGVSVRPYIIVGGTVSYGDQVYVEYDKLKEQEAIQAAHSEIISNSKADNEGRIRFSANFAYTGEQDATYGILIYRSDATGVELTVDNAENNQVCGFETASFTAKDTGNGVTLRTYILIDGEYIYGAQRTYLYTDFT